MSVTSEAIVSRIIEHTICRDYPMFRQVDQKHDENRERASRAIVELLKRENPRRQVLEQIIVHLAMYNVDHNFAELLSTLDSIVDD